MEATGCARLTRQRAADAVKAPFDRPASRCPLIRCEHDGILLDRDLPDIHGDQVCAELVAADGPSIEVSLPG